MNPDPNNQVVRETAVFDGDTPTEQEQLLMDQGVGEEPTANPTAEEEAAAAAKATEEAAAAAASTPDAIAAAAAKAEEERVAAEAAEQQRIAESNRAAAEAQANADAIARAAATAKPEPPKDFDKEFEKLEQLRADDDIEPAEYSKQLRALTIEEAQHNTTVQLWESDQQRRIDDAKTAGDRAQNAWNAAALQWEADNADFLANPLRQANMQQAINLVIQNNRAAGVVQAAADVLAAAAKIAFDYSNYTPPAPTAVVDPKQVIAEAVGARKPAATSTTLGDLPNAGPEAIKGDEAFAALDNLSIEDLEATVQHMTPAQQEKFLLDAPGAKSNGRGNDPADKDE